MFVIQLREKSLHSRSKSFFVDDVTLCDVTVTFIVFRVSDVTRRVLHVLQQFVGVLALVELESEAVVVGQVLAEIIDPQLGSRASVKATKAGTAIGKLVDGLVIAGDAVMHIAYA